MGRSVRDQVADFWDDIVRATLAGGRPHLTVPKLTRWFAGYRGAGRGAVTVGATPEPYIGPLRVGLGDVRLVALGLNPGQADLRFQGLGGVFAREYEQLGGFAAWAATEPYLREPWALAHPRNPYHQNLRAFARRWLGDATVQSRELLVFELYPWHSDAATGTIAPDADLVDEFIWRPIAEIDVAEVFAIGAPWQRHAEHLGLMERQLDVRFSDRTRRARCFSLPSGQRLVVTWHQASNAPPNAADVQALKAALVRHAHATHAATSKRGSTPVDRRPPPPASIPRRTGTAGSRAYSPFWAQLTARLHRERPAWKLGTPHGNDHPLVTPLPGARIKCNFSRVGLRVELLLHSRDRTMNLRRLEVLTAHLPALQNLMGPNAVLVPEPLEGRTQARIAAYHPGRLDDESRWPVFLDWFETTAISLNDALEATLAGVGAWPA